MGIGLSGALAGAWISSMIGVNVPNSQLKNFHRAVEQGEILLLVDVPKKRAGDIKELVRQHHPEAGFEGVEPTIPAFP